MKSVQYALLVAATLGLGACVEKSLDAEVPASEENQLAFQIVAPGDSALDADRSEIYALLLQGDSGQKVLVRDSSLRAFMDVDAFSNYSKNVLNALQTDSTGAFFPLNSAWRDHAQEIEGLLSRYNDSNRVARDWKPLRLGNNYSYAVAQPTEEGQIKTVAESFPGYDRLVSFSWAEILEEEGLAIVEVFEYRGSLDASRDCYLLERKEGKWVIAYAMNLWVS